MESKVKRFERYRSFIREKGPMLETLDFIFHIGITPQLFIYSLIRISAAKFV